MGFTDVRIRSLNFIAGQSTSSAPTEIGRILRFKLSVFCNYYFNDNNFPDFMNLVKRWGFAC